MKKKSCFCVSIHFLTSQFSRSVRTWCLYDQADQFLNQSGRVGVCVCECVCVYLYLLHSKDQKKYFTNRVRTFWESEDILAGPGKGLGNALCRWVSSQRWKYKYVCVCVVCCAVCIVCVCVCSVYCVCVVCSVYCVFCSVCVCVCVLCIVQCVLCVCVCVSVLCIVQCVLCVCVCVCVCVQWEADRHTPHHRKQSSYFQLKTKS